MTEDSPLKAVEDNNVQVLRTDAVIAKEIRDELTPLLERVCSVLNKARACGMNVGLGINPDSFGRFRANVDIVKPL